MKTLLQPLFSQPILHVTSLDPGYKDHGSDVWLVETADERVVVRSSRMLGPTDELNDFWWGCRHLFGIEPWRTFDLEVIHRTLSQAHTLSHGHMLSQAVGFRIPQVLRKGVIGGREYVVVECVDGKPLQSFTDLSEEALVEFGKRLAAIHALAFDFCGHMTRRVAYPLGAFHEHVAGTMRGEVRRFYTDDPDIVAALDVMCNAVLALPVPEVAAPVLVDMDPTQFMVHDGYVSALVDAEAYGVGPRELDFVALEYCLDQASATLIAQGYSKVLPLPDLSRVRTPYRYLYRLFSIQGSVPLDEWLDHPHFF